MQRATRLSQTLAKGYQDIIDDNGLTAQMSQAGLSGAIAVFHETCHGLEKLPGMRYRKMVRLLLRDDEPRDNPSRPITR